MAKMTKTQARKMTRQLINASAKEMREQLERVFLSGAVNIGSYEDNWLLPKIILTALLRDQATTRLPIVLSKKEQRKIDRAIKNIYIQI